MRYTNHYIRLISSKVPFKYVHHQSFDDLTSETAIESPCNTGYHTQYPLLSKVQEQQLFRQMNCYKHCANLTQKRLAPGTYDLAYLYDRYASTAVEIQHFITCCNMRLVLMITRKIARTPLEILEMASEGNLALVRSVINFDFSKNIRFSTYAYYSIQNACITFRAHDKIKAINDPYAIANALTPLPEKKQYNIDDIKQAMLQLTPKEREVIELRFGLDEYGDGECSFRELGKLLNMSYARAQQISAGACKKLRDILLAS